MKPQSFQHLVEQELGQLPHFVIYAFLELTLMAILLLDGGLAYVASLFAEVFELVPPCLLCTRVNPLFDRGHLHYNATMCEGHKKEVSSFAYCHVHRKLSDLRTMCEACLLAFASGDNSCIPSSTNDSNKDIECMFNDELRSRLKTQGNAGPEMPTSMLCSCCGEPMNGKPSNVPNWVAQEPCSSPHTKHPELKPPVNEDGGDSLNQDVRPQPALTIPSLHLEAEAAAEELTRTPSLARGGSRRFSLLSGDSTTASPRFASRTPRKPFSERPEHISDDAFESAGMNEPEDSIVNRLKKQVKVERKSLMELSRELEEERSASAVAANNAMAMITRLQAEKASVQMEALQYQRMMDEQAEYDQEALSALHDLLEKREYEMYDMQDELELYRERYGVLGEDVIRRTDHFEKVQSFASFTEKSDHGEEEEGVVHDDEGHMSPDESVFDIETDVDPNTAINYYDQAYALYENEQLQGLQEPSDGGGALGLEQEGSIMVDQLGLSEAIDPITFGNDDDQNTTGD